MSNAAQIANTTWKQIPVMTKMACGAREPAHDEKGTLTFKVGRSMRYVSVSLNDMDLYDVEFCRLKRGSFQKTDVETASGVYADQLGEVIYHMVNK